jgi:hypothetical protein
MARVQTEDATFAVTTTVSSHCPLCGKTIRRGMERLIVETSDGARKAHAEVCGKCVAAAVLEAIARRVTDNLQRGDNDAQATREATEFTKTIENSSQPRCDT